MAATRARSLAPVSTAGAAGGGATGAGGTVATGGGGGGGAGWFTVAGGGVAQAESKAATVARWRERINVFIIILLCARICVLPQG